MFIKEPLFIQKKKTISDIIFNPDIQIVRKNPIFKKQVQETLIVSQNNKQIVKSSTEAIEFLNKLYLHKNNSEIPLHIIETSTTNANALQDIGAFYDPQYCIDNSNGLFEIHSGLLTNQKINGRKEPFAEILNKNLGLGNFTKFVVFHESGHYIDYLNRQGMLQDNNQADIHWRNFLGDDIYNKYLHNWFGTPDETNKTLKRMVQENVADCWACFLLSLSTKGLSLHKSIDTLKEARLSYHYNNPTHPYSTFNSLDRLQQNLKNKNINHPQEMVTLIHTSAQEGFIMNLKEIFENAKYHEKSVAISQDNPTVNFEQTILGTAKKLKL